MGVRERLLEVANARFYRDGINATGINAVIEEAGIARMSLYNHFPSKDALVVTYLEGRDRAWQERIAARLASEGDHRRRLLVPFDEYLEYGNEPGFHGCAFVNGAAELPEGHPGWDVVRRHKRSMVELLEELARDAGVADPERLAAHLFFVLEGAFVTAGVHGDRAPIERARALAADLVDAAVTT